MKLLEKFMWILSLQPTDQRKRALRGYPRLLTGFPTHWWALFSYFKAYMWTFFCMLLTYCSNSKYLGHITSTAVILFMKGSPTLPHRRESTKLVVPHKKNKTIAVVMLCLCIFLWIFCITLQLFCIPCVGFLSLSLFFLCIFVADFGILCLFLL